MMTNTVPADRRDPEAAVSGKYVTFLVGGETYAVPALSVLEVVSWVPVTRVPHAIASVEGVINLRDATVTVLDLRARLNLPPAEPTDRTCIVVVTVPHRDLRLQVGLVVDAALNVTRIRAKDVKARDDQAGDITGVAHTKSGLAMLLDVEGLVLDSLATALHA